MTDPSPRPTAGATTASGKAVNLRAALVLISVVQLMLVLDGTITNIALPAISRDLGLAQNTLTWLITGYALSFGGLLLLGGRLGDMASVRPWACCWVGGSPASTRSSVSTSLVGASRC